jgi:hypothetical protein
LPSVVREIVKDEVDRTFNIKDGKEKFIQNVG